jgi:hypothetical protein
MDALLYRILPIIIIGSLLTGCVTSPSPLPLGTMVAHTAQPAATSTLTITVAAPPTEYARPDDFRIEYYWSNGSVSPPYQYAYHITIESNGQSKAVLMCGYQDPKATGVPTSWTESFTVQQAKLDELHALLAQEGLYNQDWTQKQVPPVGGGVEEIIVTARGQQISIVTYIPASHTTAMFSAIRALVPPAIWTKFDDQREEYVKAHAK